MAFWVLLIAVLGMGACGGEAPPPASDAGVDQLEAAIADVAPADTGPGPTPEEWARCPENIADLGYAVRSCSNVSGAFGLTHSRRVASAVPTWIPDGLDGNRALAMEEALMLGASRGNEGARALLRCDLRQLPPPCRCATCGGQAFDIRACAGFETDGRLYLGEQLNIVMDLALRTGHCPRLQ